jgi:ADP-heptose:LPS heptosyltransferase
MKIAVLRALQLGDLLCAVPAFRALDAAYPEARITLIGLPWARAFAARFRRYIDDFLEFPGFPGMPERSWTVDGLRNFILDAENRKFDLALQMHGSGGFTNPLTVLTGARQTAGFHRPAAYRPDPARFIEWRDGEHEVLRYLRLLAHLGVPSKGTQLEFPLEPSDWRELGSFGLNDKAYAVIHPGSQLPSRRWPAERFAEVADALARDGLRIVVTGTRQEAFLIERTKRAMREPAIDLSGRTTLGGLAALIARARILVCNDTGVSHVAAAMRTPSVVVACGSDPRRWAPLNGELHRVLYREIGCRPCAHRECPIGHPCALGVSVHEVLAETNRLVECAA